MSQLKNTFTSEYWPIDRPVPYARNARKISEKAIDKVAASLKEFGWRQAIVVDSEGVIVCGHTRLLAAKKLGMDEVPVHVATGLTVAQIKAYRLMDNRSHDEAEWDYDLLPLELAELQSLDLDLSLTGFDLDQIDAMMAEKTEEGLTDPDDAPEVPKFPVSVPGDLWLLGKHRLLCGDSTVATDVERVLNGVQPHLMVTDPPYGVEYDATWRDEAAKYSASMGNWKDTAKGKVSNDDRADWSEAWALFPGDVAYIWHASIRVPDVAKSLIDSGFTLRALIIWAKSHLAIGRGHYHHQHEPCWYAVRKGSTGHWNGDRKQTTLWQIPKPVKSETGHSTQKPVECMRRPIENNSSPGQAIYEPFCGSGTTIIAAEQTGRICHAIELAPEYCDVIVKRWQDFTGKTATLDGDGRTFAELAAQRVPKDAAA